VAQIGYSLGEVLYLLSLSHEDAIDDDAGQADSCAQFTEDGHAPATAHEEWDPVMTIARWWDVRRARDRVARTKLEQEVVQLRVAGFGEHELAGLLGLSRATARRRFRASVEEILHELGGEVDQTERISIPSACLTCGDRPRARLAPVTRRHGRGRRTIRPERSSSLCEPCTPDARRHLLVGADA
jgi:hypothetical protein